MQTQMMDFDKPYGVIYGGSIARFEQNGQQYDALGSLVDAATENLAVPEATQPNLSGTPEVIFLEMILAGGPVLQSTIKKESEMAGLNWTAINDAAIFMRVHKMKQGQASVWKLNSEGV